MTDFIISVKEAREILGEDAEKMTDEEIERTIILLNQIAKEALKMARCASKTSSL